MPIATDIMGPAGRLHVDDAGSGELPVVFLHSFAGSTDHWTAQLAHLRKTRRALAIDLRGHGRSDPPSSGTYTIDSLADDVATVVDSLGLDRFVLVGHSLGGAAAIAYVGEHPERAAGLLLVGTPGQSSPDQSGQVLAALRADYVGTMNRYWNELLDGAKPEVKTRIEGERNRLPPEDALKLIQAAFDFNPLPFLNAYPGPTLLVDTLHGESPTALHRLRPALPRRVITGTSHWAQMDRPEDFNEILDEFLAIAG